MNDAGSGGERRGVSGLSDDLAKQRDLVGDGSPTYARALTALRLVVDGPTADASLVAHLQRCWRTRFFNAYYERPLLLLAALRHEALLDDKRHPLYAALAADHPDPDAITRERLLAAFSAERLGFWLTLATRRVQTNEVSRSVGWRWPAFIAGCDQGARPMALVDIGTSAGLNLVADRLPLAWTDAVGKALPVATNVDCRARVGFDPHPLDVRFDDDFTWLRACIWPGDDERLSQLDAAAAAMRAAFADESNARARAPVVQTLHAGLAPSRLEALSKNLGGDVLVIAFQSFVRGYIEPDRQEGYVRGMRAWLASAKPGRALWIEMEIAGDKNMSEPADIVAHIGDAKKAAPDGVRTFRLARCSYHPKSVFAELAAVDALQRALRA